MAQNDTQWPILPKKWFRLASNSQFWSFCRFFYLFPKMRLRLTQNGQCHPIHNFFHLLPPKHLIFGEISKILVPGWGGGYIGKIFEFFNFFKLFHSEVAQNDTQWPILPKKWLRLAPNSLFWSFCRFFYLFPKMRLKLTQNGQCHPIHNFSHLLPPKYLNFGEISKIFIPGGGGGGYIGKIFEFFNFFESFHSDVAQNDTQWPILPKTSAGRSEKCKVYG